MDKPRIRIWECNSVGLIIPMQTGVIVQNQTGGVACVQSEVEGIYVPIYTDAQEIEVFFAERGGAIAGLDQKEADFLDEFLHRDGHKGLWFLSVDRSRLHESIEAWVYVTINQLEGDLRIGVIQGFGETSGILTWPNSD